MQVAAYIGDGTLLHESANRFHNCLAPLLAAKAQHGLLIKALAACHVMLTEAKTAYAASFQVESPQCCSICRVIQRLLRRLQWQLTCKF